MKTRAGLSSNVYKGLVAEAEEDGIRQSVSAPRDRKQVENFQCGERQNLRLSRDALYNLMYASHEFKFVRYLEVVPFFVCIMWLDSLAEKILQLLDRKDLGDIAFYYDTTFKVGDFYVSVLTVKFTEYEDPSPVIPFALMFHERKLSRTHDTFFRELAYNFPSLVRKWCVVKNIHLFIIYSYI